MPGRSAKSKNSISKPVGRPGEFSGVKLEFLEQYKDEFLSCQDRDVTAFYTKVVNNFVAKFGCTLKYGANPATGVDIASLALQPIDPTLTQEEQKIQIDKIDTYRSGLREKLSQWFRHRYRHKPNASAIHQLIEALRNSSPTIQPPRKQSEREAYYELFYESKLKLLFEEHWKTIQEREPDPSRTVLATRNEFVQHHLEAEPLSFRQNLISKIESDYEKAKKVWKEGSTINHTVEGYQQAWELGGQVLPGLSNVLAEWLGASVMIAFVRPNKGKAEVASIQSSIQGSGVSKILPEYDPAGWQAFCSMFRSYGNDYFSPNDCRNSTFAENAEERNQYGNNAITAPKPAASPSSDRAVTSPGTEAPVFDSFIPETALPFNNNNSFSSFDDLSSTDLEPQNLQLPLPLPQPIPLLSTNSNVGSGLTSAHSDYMGHSPNVNYLPSESFNQPLLKLPLLDQHGSNSARLYLDTPSTHTSEHAIHNSNSWFVPSWEDFNSIGPTNAQTNTFNFSDAALPTSNNQSDSSTQLQNLPSTFSQLVPVSSVPASRDLESIKENIPPIPDQLRSASELVSGSVTVEPDLEPPVLHMPNSAPLSATGREDLPAIAGRSFSKRKASSQQVAKNHANKKSKAQAAKLPSITTPPAESADTANNRRSSRMRKGVGFGPKLVSSKDKVPLKRKPGWSWASDEGED